MSPIVGAHLLEADSQCGEESMPQLPVLPGITATTDDSLKVLKKMDTVTSLPSLEAKTGQSDDNMIRSHSELCLQNGSGNAKSTMLPKISKDVVRTQQQSKHNTTATHINSLTPVRPSNGRRLSTKPFIDSLSASLQSDNTSFHNRSFTNATTKKNSGRGHFETKRGVVMDTKVPSSMRKKLLNQNTKRHALNMAAETKATISKPTEAPHHRRKATAKREPIKKVPLSIKGLHLDILTLL